MRSKNFRCESRQSSPEKISSIRWIVVAASPLAVGMNPMAGERFSVRSSRYCMRGRLSAKAEYKPPIARIFVALAFCGHD